MSENWTQVFVLKRTLKIAVLLIFLSLLSLAFRIDLSEVEPFFPTVLAVAAFFDMSDWLWVKVEEQWLWIRSVVIKRITAGKLAKKWDLEEKMNDNRGQIRTLMVLVAIILYAFLRFIAEGVLGR